MKDKVLDLPEKPKENDYVIAYIDLLGTKELLLKSSESIVFGDIYYPFLIAGKIMPTMHDLKWDNIKIKIFSDNILIAHPVNDPKNKDDVYRAYKEVSNFLKFFLSMFANKGILFRGAITVDKLLINELMVWGKGLSAVVYLEENVAIYPRIIISEDLLKVFDSFELTGVDFEEKFSCLQDSDDCVFFDFFDYDDFESMESLLELTREYIEKKIKAGASPRVMQKYRWFKNYIARVAEIYQEIRQSV